MKFLQKSRTVVFNIEANGLNPKEIWVVTCTDVNTGEIHVFRRPDLQPDPFISYMGDCVCGVGHNVINYDIPCLERLVRGYQRPKSICDTLVVSRLLDYSRSGGHSLESWAGTLGLPKGKQPPWTEFSEDLVNHCLENVSVTLALYKTFLPYLNSPRWQAPIETEMFCATVLQQTHENGFHFSVDRAKELRYNILEELSHLDRELETAFPPKVSLVREITPRITKFGTLNRNDFRWAGNDLSSYNGGAFSLIEYVDFNPGSPSQIVERLNEAGWKPTERTKGYLIAAREKNEEKLAKYHAANSGWMVSETNLETLPDTAPPPAKNLALRITLASRSRTLSEWIEAYRPDTGRIHGTINVLGAWTHRCSHVKPNTGNIPTPQPLDKTSTFLKKRANEIDSILRTYWCAAPDSHLVGVDAEGIQLRVLAHYINDPRFTKAVTEGNKDDGTDPHSLNNIALGEACKSRADAKTFIYGWLLGAGIGKVAQILGCSSDEARRACDAFVRFYPGLQIVKEDRIPRDANRGYFEGFDGRYVSIFGDDAGSRRHFCLAGYLQNGEVVVMKRAMQIWLPKLVKEKIPFELVNFVHDEWVTQVNADRDTADYVADTQADAIREAGIQLNLLCPMAGSKSVGLNWKEVH